jgi:magnesium-transporting ATPase (P-type)
LVVVGDILKFDPGMSIPADGILLDNTKVKMDEAAMTGESILLGKNVLESCLETLEAMKAKGRKLDDHTIREIPSPVLLSGTQISTGEGRLLVISVGENSCVGQVLASLRQKPTMTPLQKKLEGVANYIGKLGLYTALVTVAVLFIRYFISRISYGGWTGSDVALCFKFIILGITVLIVAIPEGLPLAVTIALAYSVSKMYEEKNLVKTRMVSLYP